MKLTKGTLKVIIGNADDCAENDARARANGKIFKPPYTIYEWNEDLKTVDRHVAFSVIGANLRPRTAISRFPYVWAPRPLQDVRLWMETRGEVTLQTTYEESTANG
jgi:hypothetical protein